MKQSWPVTTRVALGKVGGPTFYFPVIYGIGRAAFRFGKAFCRPSKTYFGNLQKTYPPLLTKERELLFPEDVKRYFSNYIAAGSVTCRTLRETLLKELENTVDKDVNRFESVVDGRRTYLGHLIPVDAPPRPDASAVWDDVKKRWAH